MASAPTPKSWIAAIHAYVPGKSAGADGRPLVKLSANENPLGTSPAALAAMAQAVPPHLYPDPDSTALRQALGALHGIDPARIICGTGSGELLEIAAAAFAGPGDECVYVRYGFSLYDIVIRRCGAEHRDAIPPGRVARVEHATGLQPGVHRLEQARRRGTHGQRELRRGRWIAHRRGACERTLHVDLGQRAGGNDAIEAVEPHVGVPRDRARARGTPAAHVVGLDDDLGRGERIEAGDDLVACGPRDAERRHERRGARRFVRARAPGADPLPGRATRAAFPVPQRSRPVQGARDAGARVDRPPTRSVAPG